MKDRPKTLREIAERAEDLRHFGFEFADWLHTVRSLSSRPELSSSISEEPPLLRERFPEGSVCDAWLAAYAEHLALEIAADVPGWAKSPERIANKAWFASEIPAARQRALQETPSHFKRRNLFTDAVDLPLRLRAGRPRKSDAEKRRANAERQRRHRNRRALEFELGRHAARIAMAE